MVHQQSYPWVELRRHRTNPTCRRARAASAPRRKPPISSASASSQAAAELFARAGLCEHHDGADRARARRDQALRLLLLPRQAGDLRDAVVAAHGRLLHLARFRGCRHAPRGREGEGRHRAADPRHRRAPPLRLLSVPRAAGLPRPSTSPRRRSSRITSTTGSSRCWKKRAAMATWISTTPASPPSPRSACRAFSTAGIAPTAASRPTRWSPSCPGSHGACWGCAVQPELTGDSGRHRDDFASTGPRCTGAAGSIGPAKVQDRQHRPLSGPFANVSEPMLATSSTRSMISMSRAACGQGKFRGRFRTQPRTWQYADLCAG